jgi:serine/threonine-protein kinase
MRLRFGPFAFDPQSRLLWRDGTEVALPPRVLGVLEALLDRPGQVVPRQDLLDRVWKDAFVTDTSLAEAVSFLRQALGDDPQSPRFIQTVHRRGYRFLVTPEPEGSVSGQTGVKPGSDQPQAGGRPHSDPSPTPAERAPRRAADWQLVPWSIAALCAGLAIAAVWHTATATPQQAPPVARFELRTAPGTTFDREDAPIAISPDGRSFAWSACEIATDRCALYVRGIDHQDAQPLAGTGGAHTPVFSPDGRWIAFFADGALKKIAAGGGAPTPLASAPDPGGATWTSVGRILFAPSRASGIAQIDGEGATAAPMTRPAADRGELRHRAPASIAAMGRGNAFAFIVASDPDDAAPGALAVAAPDLPATRVLRTGVHRAVPAGHTYLLLSTASDLQAATFDDRSLVLTGSSDSVPAPGGDGVVQFAVSASALALVRAPVAARRLWSDGADAASLARFTSIALSPDARRAAGVVVDRGTSDIWIADLTSGTTTRLSFGGTNVSPAWSADGERILYATRNGAGPFHVVSQAVSDRADAVAPVPGMPEQAFPTSAAARVVALTRYRNEHTAVIVVENGSAPRVLAEGPYDEGAAALSPDGRWVALESSASGRVEIIVRATADGRRVAAVSNDGGHTPHWSADGRAIYFTHGRRLLCVPFAPGADGPASPAQPVLDRAGDRPLAVTPAGRILIERRQDPDSAVVVLQWLRELGDRLPLPVNPPR